MSLHLFKRKVHVVACQPERAGLHFDWGFPLWGVSICMAVDVEIGACRCEGVVSLLTWERETVELVSVIPPFSISRSCHMVHLSSSERGAEMAFGSRPPPPRDTPPPLHDCRYNQPRACNHPFIQKQAGCYCWWDPTLWVAGRAPRTLLVARQASRPLGLHACPIS